MDKSLTFKLILLLAVVQACAGVVRGFNWVQLGGNLLHQGLLLFPMLGAVAIMRGLFLAAVALLYVLFVIGALLGKPWARWPGVTAAIINLLLVLSALSQGASVSQAIAWSAIPVILLIYIFSEHGRQPVRSHQPAR